MFEKESKLWATKELGNGYVDDIDNHSKTFQKGAEFGYNKAKEEAKDIINELLMNGYSENTREKALNFLYPDKEE
jgi:hypothetical protein